MIKTCVTAALVALMFTITIIDPALAKTPSKKSNDTKIVKKNKKKKIQKPRNKKYKRVRNGPDLRALTTELPNNEYTEIPDNGVNSLENKTGL